MPGRPRDSCRQGLTHYHQTSACVELNFSFDTLKKVAATEVLGVEVIKVKQEKNSLK